MPGEEILLWDNPYGRRKRRRHMARNPLSALMPKSLLQGVDVMDIVGGAAGLATAAALPKYFIPDAQATTTSKKLQRVAIAVLGAVAVGFVVATWDKRAAKGAVIGGLAGTAITAVNTFTSVKIGATPGQEQVRLLGDGSAAGDRVGRVATRAPGVFNMTRMA